MKVLCSISSVEFSCDYFPGSLYSREISHPVFFLPQKKLLSYLGKWAGNELTETDSYLLFLALLNSSELIDFRTPVFRNEKTPAIIAANMEHLAKSLCQINTVSTPSFNFPRFAVTPGNNYLTNVHHWIEAWDEAFKNFKDGYRSAHENQKLIRRELALERLIKNPHKKSSYGTALAEWASQAGSFPTFLINDPFSSTPSLHKISVGDYWKAIIIKACSEDQVYGINRNDLIELLEHCEENISIGSIFGHALFKTLRTALEKQKNYLGMGDITLTNGNYSFVSGDITEAANMQAMIQKAPSEEPKRKDFDKMIDYLKAKMRWEMAKASKEDRDSLSLFS